MEQILDIEKPKPKIYNYRAIGVGTFLGGPLVAGYFIAENFLYPIYKLISNRIIIKA